MALFRRRFKAESLPPPDMTDPINVKLAAAQAARDDWVVVTREQAMANSVVNRARDVTCGVVGSLPFTRKRQIGAAPVEDLGAGWLHRPDPDHTSAWFVSWITDDLFFYGYAYARVTSHDYDGQPNALQWMPFLQVVPNPSRTAVGFAAPGGGRLVALPGQDVTWYPLGYLPNRRGEVLVPAADLVIFESPLTGLLGPGRAVLTIAARLDDSASRFAAATIPAGWLEQVDGEDLTGAELAERADSFAAARMANAIGAVNRYMKYQESTMDPSRLQLVEGRSYQDVAAARVCNVPAFIVNAAVPGDSMTYKTALTARLDLLDFGLQPYVTCWEQTLSGENVTPRGTTVAFDLEPFLRTTTLSGLIGPGVAAPADVKTA